MAPSHLRLGLVFALGSLACSHAPPREPKPKPLARSSIDAVLTGAAAVGLTDEQVRSLMALDQAREKRDTQLRADIEAARKKPAKPAEQPTPPPDAPPAGMGGRHGGRGGGGGHHAQSAAPRTQLETLEEKLDDSDTQSFMEAEKLLTEQQRPTAEDLAGNYRAALWDYRESLKPPE